jgi:hypothetical protein
MGVIEEAGNKFDPATKMTVMSWRATNSIPRKLEKRESASAKIKRLEAEIIRLEKELALKEVI